MPTLDLGRFDPLAFYRYRVDFTLARPLTMPAAQRAVLWRGAFGTVFRALVCHDVTLACDACPLRSACPFPSVFAPTIPADRPVIARLKDPPRPFVLADPRPDALSLPAGMPLALGLTLVGTAVSELPYFVVALRRLGEEGVGHSRSRFVVDRVRCVDATGVPGETVFEHGSDVVRAARLELRARDLARPGDAAATRARVRFTTPTDLRRAAIGRSNGPEAPAFGTLIRRARDRAGALATFFGHGPLAADPRGVAALADEVVTLSSDVLDASLSRSSARTGQRHRIGGIVGTAVYEGTALGEVMPWLRLAEALGVGKHATFGNGRIEVEVVG